MMSDSARTTYRIRVEGTANSYGLGEAITERVTLFHDGCYGLTWDQLQSKLKALPKGTVLR